MVYTTERIAFCHRRLRDDKLSAATFQKAIKLAKEKLVPNHMQLSKAYLNNGIRAHFKNNFFKSRFALAMDTDYACVIKLPGTGVKKAQL